MSIKTKFALSAVIVLSTVATASAATKKQKIAVHRSGPHVQAIVPRTAPLFNLYSPAATGGGSPGYNQKPRYLEVKPPYPEVAVPPHVATGSNRSPSSI
jgi:hypothetical protein